MAAGLGLLGRGRRTNALPLGALHVLGATLAGAALGLVLGGAGSLLGLPTWRPWVIAAAALVALGLGLRRRPPRLGRQRQVPRRWAPGISAGRVYAIWGAMLGCGVATPIFHTAFLLLGGAQLTAGIGLGAVSGAFFGLARQGVALVPVLRRFGPERTMGLMETLRPTARRANLVLVVAAGLVLVLASR